MENIKFNTNKYLKRMQLAGDQSNYNQQLNATRALKQMYKNELDNILRQREKLKQFQEQRQQQQKKTFNERIEKVHQMEKMKDISYKNYYQMLMEGQQQHLQTYVSPFAKRDNMKLEHINHSIEDQRKKAEQEQISRALKKQSMKESYKKGLMQQLEERVHLQSQKRLEREREKQHYNRISTGPTEADQWEKEKKRDQMSKYRQGLQRGISEKQGTQIKTNRQNNAAFYPKSPGNYHNPIYNPLPFNIQNPYIMRDLQRNGLSQNNNYFANVAYNNLTDREQHNK